MDHDLGFFDQDQPGVEPVDDPFQNQSVTHVSGTDLENNGGDEGIRTLDLLSAIQALFRAELRPHPSVTILAASGGPSSPSTRTRPIYRVGEGGRHANITTRPARIPIAVGEKTVQPSPPVHQWTITVRGTEVNRQAFAERTLQKR